RCCGRTATRARWPARCSSACPPRAERARGPMGLPGTTSPTPLRRALDTIARLRAQLDQQRRSHSLAIVGVGLRLPGSDGGPIDSLDDYWQAMADGRDLVRVMPE